ncbi:MAG: hypothetical protein WD738_01590 [Pirellulales bacterium]
MATNPKKPASQKKQPSNVKKARSVKRPGVTKPGACSALPYQPGISPVSVDVTGIVPEDVHVDPDITEGHPGYEESGGSGIQPLGDYPKVG